MTLEFVAVGIIVAALIALYLEVVDINKKIK